MEIKKRVIKIDIHINKTILDKILNDDIGAELKEIVDKELSKPPKDINWSEVADVKNAINLIKDGDEL